MVSRNGWGRQAFHVLTLVLVTGLSLPAGAQGLLRPDDAGVAAVGEKVYAQHCAACHGAKLEGEANWRQRKASGRLPAPPHDATGHTWHHPDRLLFRITKYGPGALIGGGHQSDMPGFEKVLTDAEILAVLSFIKSTWPAGVRKIHDEINQRAQ